MDGEIFIRFICLSSLIGEVDWSDGNVIRVRHLLDEFSIILKKIDPSYDINEIHPEIPTWAKVHISKLVGPTKRRTKPRMFSF